VQVCCINPKFNYMKKAIMFIALVATSVAGANAQKFQGGEKNLEVNFSPMGATPISIESIRFRMFNSESSAIRVGFSISGSTKTDVMSQSGPNDIDAAVTDPELYSTDKTFGFSLRPGYEKHFAGTDRLSPYVGAELVFAMNSKSRTEEYRSGNSATTADDPANWSTWTAERKDGTTTFGLNAVAGADFYFADNFYLGVEIGLGFKSVKQKDVEITVSDENAWLWGPVTHVEDFLTVNAAGKMEVASIIGDGTGAYKNFNWNPSAQGTLRLGWLF
jgi:hypothetical protein